MFGEKTQALPIPLDPESTIYCPAGVLTFAVERRHINQAIADEAFADDPVAREHSDAKYVEYERENGVPLDVRFKSLHVLGSDGLEYLRFDIIAEYPHYHYVTPAEPCDVLWMFDSVANGDFAEWVFGRLRTQLRDMLTAASAPRESLNFDQAVIEDVLHEVEAEVLSSV
ncbi:MAG: hypothetical protein JWO37_3713 [Acidimicrobiales bacterium]|jgi:hypothetical protein|nr:hypothetical protein [Acidimicrobiales bacterium]